MKLPSIVKDILRAIVKVIVEKLLGAEKKEPPPEQGTPGDKE